MDEERIDCLPLFSWQEHASVVGFGLFVIIEETAARSAVLGIGIEEETATTATDSASSERSSRSGASKGAGQGGGESGRPLNEGEGGQTEPGTSTEEGALVIFSRRLGTHSSHNEKA